MAKPKNAYSQIRAETLRMIEGEEGYEVEFKESMSGLDAEDIVAFANGDGGTILIGVGEIGKKTRQRGEIVGCEISDRMKLKVLNKAHSCHPKVDVIIIAEGIKTDKPIYRIDIPVGNRKPYCTAGGTYKTRKDGQKISIDPELMETIIFQREEKEFINRFKAAGDEILESLGQLGVELDEKIEHVASIAEDAALSAQEAAAAAEESSGEFC